MLLKLIYMGKMDPNTINVTIVTNNETRGVLLSLSNDDVTAICTFNLIFFEHFTIFLKLKFLQKCQNQKQWN